MPEIDSIEKLYLALAFVVPGLVIVYVRSRFIGGKIPSHKDNILGYITLSILYYAFVLPVVDHILRIQTSLLGRATCWIGLILIGPAIFGIILGAWAQKEWGGRLAKKFGLDTIHVIPTAWDWRFSKFPRGGMFVMITLTSGEAVAGFFGTSSFASSDGTERDIYIEEEYAIDDGIWKVRPEKVGVLIPVKEIRYVEFWEP